jgi:hypothetical protein
MIFPWGPEVDELACKVGGNGDGKEPVEVIREAVAKVRAHYGVGNNTSSKAGSAAAVPAAAAAAAAAAGSGVAAGANARAGVGVVGPCRHCSPRHGIPSNSIFEGSKCVG